jgi:hypothetical protein
VGFGTVVVDDARAHVLISGPSANAVEVLDFAGNLVQTLTNIHGAWGMVVSGRYLYVAESSAGAIVRVDLNAPTPAATTVATGLVQPRWLIMKGGKLWTTVAAPGMSGWWGSIASVDPKSGKVGTFSQTYYSPDLAVSPALADTLFVSEDGRSPGAVYRLDVSTAKPKLRASNTFTDQQNIEDLAVSPDGTRVILASGYPYLYEELSATTLQPDGLSYPGSPYRRRLRSRRDAEGYSRPVSTTVTAAPTSRFSRSERRHRSSPRRR